MDQPRDGPDEVPAPGAEPTDAGEAPAAPDARDTRDADIPPDAPRRDGWGTFWNVVLIVDLVVLGVLMLGAIAMGLILLLAPDSGLATRYAEAARNVSAADLRWDTLVQFLLIGGIPIAWAFGSRVQPWEGGLRYLRLRRWWPDAGKGALFGTGLWLALVAITALFMLIFEGPAALGEALAESPVAEGLIAALDWPLVFLIAGAAAVGEEVLFRGILQKHIGLWGQAIIFGITHAGYGTVPNVLWPFAVGLLFGWWMKRGASLWMPILAHFMFNFIQLALALMFRDAV